jgi:DNA-binding NtrC family response regulator
MKMNALRFKLEGQSTTPVRDELSLESADDLDTLKKEHPLTAFVLEGENLRLFREGPKFKSKVIDCGMQKDSWELSRSMLHQENVPIIEGKYKVAGRLIHGVETLLKKAAVKQDDNLYFVGTQQALFGKLWEKADPASVRVRSTPKKSAARGSLAGNLSARILLDMMPPSRVPEEFAEEYVGDSDDVKLVRHLSVKAARSRVPVLILGESGTGKELVARNIHRFSDRANRLFVSINCSAIPKELLEMELFGCEPDVIQKGYPLKTGLWEHAKDGTLFLDEVGDLSPDHQVKILRTLAEGKIRRVGGLKDIPVSARVISATNRELFSMVQAKTYRMDLYYRLRGFLISTPALRDHRGDIPNISQTLWSRIAGDKHRPLSARVLRELQAYHWQGNVRELKVLLGAAVTLFGKRDLRVEHIRALRLYEDQLGEHPPRGSARGEEVEPHWMDRLRHLRRVEEFIQAFRQSLHHFLEGHRVQGRDATSVQQAFRNRRDELEPIWQNRRHLSAKASRAVEDLRETLDVFQKLVDADLKAAFKKRDALKGKLDRTLQAILKEAGKILKSI